MKSYTVVPDHSQCHLDIMQAALDRSRNFSERVAVEFHGTTEDLFDAIRETTDDDIDDATENDGTLDVWGWTPDTPDNDEEWRLKVTLV